MSLVKAEWHEDYIIANGINLHYVTQGKGPLMLMLHGFPEFWYSWRHQIPEFAHDYQVVALDLRGYNESDKPKNLEDYKMEDFVEDVKGVIQGLGYESCILVGHDWGGAIAWNFTYAHPDLVEKLIVMNMPHPAKLMEGIQTPLQLWRSWYIFLFQLPWVPELLFHWNDYQAIDSIFVGSAVDKTAFTPTDLEAYKDAAAKRGALTAMLNYYRNVFPDLLNDKQSQWSVLNVPTLMVWGEEDQALGKELTYGTEKFVQNLRIKYIPNCSHWVQQEQPLVVNQYMRQFLQDN
jgi:pimeloyl-ACP methyl ester carboxylesterase